MTGRSRVLLAAVVLLPGGLAKSTGNAQEISGRGETVQLTGLPGIKDNAKGKLNVENNRLHFVHGKTSSDVSTTSIEDVVTGADTKEAVGKTVGMMSMAAPYESGQFLSLFRKKIDTLTVQYRDSDGGLHGAIFTMPVGTAEVLKKELVAQGARTTAASELNSRTSNPLGKNSSRPESS
jgi:hypothetical protein